MLFSLKNEYISDIGHNMGEHWKHCAKWNKLKYMAWFNSYEVPRIDKFRETETKH